MSELVRLWVCLSLLRFWLSRDVVSPPTSSFCGFWLQCCGLVDGRGAQRHDVVPHVQSFTGFFSHVNISLDDLGNTRPERWSLFTLVGAKMANYSTLFLLLTVPFISTLPMQGSLSSSLLSHHTSRTPITKVNTTIKIVQKILQKLYFVNLFKMAAK